MTTASTHGDKSGAGSGSSTAALTAPELISLPPVSGGQSDVLGDVLRAGLDPGGAFGAAFALNRAVGTQNVNDTLTRLAGRAPRPAAPDAAPGQAAPQTAPQTSLDGSAGSPMDGATTQVGPAAIPDPAATPDPAVSTPDPASAQDPAAAAPKSAPAATATDAAAAGEEAAKDAKRSIARAFAEDGVRAAAREGGVLAAKRGAALGSKLAATSLLRLGGLSVPGLGAAITVALWMIDTDERKAFNNLIASTIGGGSEAPALDAAPEPPRTSFLPLTHDGNRDPAIEGKDHGMVRTNAAAFGYNPDDVWPTANPNIETTSDFASVAHHVNSLNAKLTQLCESVQGIYGSAPDEQYVQASWANTKPGLDALADFQSSQLPAIGAQLMAGATSANNAYQGLRGVNLKNRQEINNSTSGLIPFTANHVNEGNMSDSTSEMKSAVDDMERVVSTLSSAADTFSIKPNRAVTAGEVTPQQPDAPAPADPAPAPPGAPGAALPPAAPAPTPDDSGNRDLASLLRGLGPGGMPMGGAMPGMPQIPGLGGGGTPQIPSLGAGGPKPEDVDKPLDKAALQKALDDEKKNGSDDPKKAPGDPGDPNAPGAAPAPGPGQQVKVHQAGLDPANPASNTTDIGGRKWTFDSPKLASMAHNLTGTDGVGHKSVTQAASDAGFKLPLPGQDIGQNIPADQIKPGDVVMGANNHNGMFLGLVDGQAMALTESGEVKPLSEVAQFDGPHQGFFRLADDGAPASAAAAPVQAAAAEQPAAPPAPPMPPAAPASDPGVMPGQTTGPTGLNPGQAPTSN
jgi:hypothetical protein